MAILNVLVLNAGSSSLKASRFAMDRPGEDGDAPAGIVWQKSEEGSDNIDQLLSTIENPESIGVIGHRVVFGGSKLSRPTRITAEVRTELKHLCEYAPAHNAAALKGIDAAFATFGNDTPQVAVFDTEFHSTLAPDAFTYAGPRSWLDQGIRRFGFHGLSHRYTSSRASRLLGARHATFRVVTCHLGSGCSLAAVRDGKSVDTTMGFTPMDGIPMARRSGAVDPGILIHLLRHGGETVDSLDRMLNHDSGLAGLSGTSGDMREILTALDAGQGNAKLAFDVFVHRVRCSIAAMAASMGGIDALVFSGGIGEHAPRARAAIMKGLKFLGIEFDADSNLRSGGERIISATGSRTTAMVIPAEENWVIARDCFGEILPAQ